MRIVYVGSFDPAHFGHRNTLQKARNKYANERIEVVVCYNELKKNGLFSLVERQQIAEDLFGQEVMICRTNDEIRALVQETDVLIRGYRNEEDVKYANALLEKFGEGARAIIDFFEIDQKFSEISSSKVKRLMSDNPEKVENMVSPVAYRMMMSKLKEM